jgi:Spy/CpxP family protein refolding chaperone
MNGEANEMKRLSVLVVAMVLAASSAWAFRGGCGMGPGFGMSPYFLSTLELTEDQKAQIQAKQEAFLEDIGPLRDKLFSKKMEMKDLWAKANPDQSAISEKRHEIQSLQNEIQEKATQYQLDCRQFLTTDQREKLGTLVAQHGGRGGMGMGMGHRRGMQNR